MLNTNTTIHAFRPERLLDMVLFSQQKAEINIIRREKLANCTTECTTAYSSALEISPVGWMLGMGLDDIRFDIE